MRELYKHSHSFFHQMDARVKLIFTLGFILSLSLSPFGAWPAYILSFAVVLSATLLSHLGVGLVLRRSLLAVPFVLAAFPLVFAGPPPHSSLTMLPGLQVVHSPEGLERFASIAVRSWVSVQAAVLLAATTRFPDLLLALRQLKVPALFVMIVGLMWRYLFVIGEEVTRMLCARSSRSASLPGYRHSGGSLLWRARVAGGMAGSLFLRSLERSDRVYAAMLCRGYNGELPIWDTTPLSRQDRRTLILGALLLGVLWMVGLLTGG